MKINKCGTFMCVTSKPRHWHTFHGVWGGGDVFDGGGNISDTHGPGGRAALQPFTAASTIILLDQAGHYPTNTHL